MATCGGEGLTAQFLSLMRLPSLECSCLDMGLVPAICRSGQRLAHGASGGLCLCKARGSPLVAPAPPRPWCSHVPAQQESERLSARREPGKGGDPGLLEGGGSVSSEPRPTAFRHKASGVRMEPLQRPGLQSLAAPPASGEGSEEALTRPPLRPLPCVGYPTLPQLLETLLEILQTDRPGAWQGPRGSQFSCSVLLLVRKLLRLGIPAPRWCPGHHQFCAWPSALRGHVADAQSARRGGQGACVGKVL